MFASIRRYRLRSGSMDDLARRVDSGFAERLSAMPGFVSYEFLDCGEGDVMTISVFHDGDGAHRSRELAQQWTDENLGDFEFTRREALQGEILVSRAAEEMLEPGHAGAAGRFASVRRYEMASGSVAELMRSVDDVFADAIASLDGFVAYHVLDCGRGEILSVSLLRDQATAEETDEMALRFVTERLSRFGLQRTELVCGEVVVSRAMAEMLVPTHA
jgi:heme-degrading monooxygenase HmoA